MVINMQLVRSAALALQLLCVATADSGLQKPVFECSGTRNSTNTAEESATAAVPAWVQRAWCCQHRGLDCVVGASPPKRMEKVKKVEKVEKEEKVKKVGKTKFVRVAILVVATVGLTLAGCTVVAVFAVACASLVQCMKARQEAQHSENVENGGACADSTYNWLLLHPVHRSMLWQPPPQAPGSHQNGHDLEEDNPQLHSVAKKPRDRWMPFRSMMHYARRKQDVFLPLSQGGGPRTEERKLLKL